MTQDILVWDSKVIYAYKIFLTFGSCNRAKASIQLFTLVELLVVFGGVGGTDC